MKISVISTIHRVGRKDADDAVSTGNVSVMGGRAVVMVMIELLFLGGVELERATTVWNVHPNLASRCAVSGRPVRDDHAHPASTDNSAVMVLQDPLSRINT